MASHHIKRMDQEPLLASVKSKAPDPAINNTTSPATTLDQATNHCCDLFALMGYLAM